MHWKCLLIVAAALMARPASADLLASFASNSTYVTVNQNGQGVSGGAVAWSDSSARSPAANYTGPVYYGGATGSLAITAAGMGVANSTPDYMNVVTASGSAGNWVVLAPLLLLDDPSAITSMTVRARATGGPTIQTNYLRLVIQQDGNLYISGTNFYNIGVAPLQTFNASTLASATWYSYDPVNNLLGNEAALATGFSATNASAVGVLLYNENVGGANRAASVGISELMVYGDIVVVPEPSALLLLGFGALGLMGRTLRHRRTTPGV